MDSYAFYNGAFGKKEDISIPLSDRAIFFADAVYDAAIGSYDRILWEEEHIDRFLLNAKRIGIDHDFTKRYISELLHEIAIRITEKVYFIYFQMSRSLKARNHCPRGSKASLLITVEPISTENKNTPLKLITEEDMRHGYCDIKTVNLLPAVLSMAKAEREGCDEAVFVKKGIVTECSKSNIAIIKRGRIITHPKTNDILPGIAREHMLICCQRLNIPICERKFGLDELMEADEVLVTSTTKLCKTAGYLNQLPIGGKSPELAQKLCNEMHNEFVDFCIK